MILNLLQVVLVISALLIFLFAIHKLGAKFSWPAEWQRKILHIGLGITALSFPFFFSYNWQVLSVSIIAIIILLVIRNIPHLRNNIGSTLYQVKRDSLGELLFAVTIVVLFMAAKNNLALYIIPIAILTLSDAMAAIIGTQYGKQLYDVIGGSKSWEGTFTFAIITFLLMVGLLALLTNMNWQAILLISLTFAILGALIEAVLWHGWDNLLVPIGAYLFLNAFISQTELQLFYQLCMLVLLVIICMIASPRSQLKTHALMCAIISLYLFWVVGSIAWLAAPIIVLICHIALVKLQSDEHSYTMNAVISVNSGGYFWLLIETFSHFQYCFFLYTLTLAIHLQIICLLRLKAFRKKKAEPIIVLLAAIFSGGLLLSTTLIYYGVGRNILILYGYALTLMFIGGITLGVQADRLSKERWQSQALLSISGSLTTLLPIGILQYL